MRRWEAIRPISEVNHVPANIQMQKTGAGVAYQGDTAFPASDLGVRRTAKAICGSLIQVINLN
jgi:hypothetical protein